MNSEDHKLIAHQEIGASFSGTYYVESIFVKKTVSNKDYTDMTLRDKSGSRNVKYWGRVEDVEKGDYAFVSANVEEYQGNPSIIARNVEKERVPDDLSNFIPSDENSEENAKEFDKIRGKLEELEKSFENNTASKLIDSIYGNGGFFSKLIVSPGSNKPHYGKQGGLLNQIVRLASSAMAQAEFYSLTDKEKAILIASALLCRIGAVDAYEFSDCAPVLTKRGILTGMNNLTMGRITLALKRGLPDCDVDIDTVIRITHAVTSHMGWDTKPMTKEALILSASYRSDSEIVSACDFIEEDQNEMEEFTAFNPEAKRQYYKG